MQRDSHNINSDGLCVRLLYIIESDTNTLCTYVCAAGFTLMGFKPKSRVKQHCYIKPANFIYPDETVSNLLLSVHVFQDFSFSRIQ